MSAARSWQWRTLLACRVLVVAGGIACLWVTTTHAQVPAAETAALMERARTWFARDRFDMAREALDRLFRLDPNNADGLAMLAEIEVRAAQFERANAVLARLRAANARHPGITRVETMLRLEGPDRDKLRQARLLARSGQTKQAIVTFRALYPDGPPGGDLALEYWQLVGATADGWAAAQAGLARLVREQPENLRYRLALAENDLSRRPINTNALRTVIDMARLPQFARQAQATWRRAVMRLDDTPENMVWLQSYVQQAPEDTGAHDRLAAMTRAVAKRQQLLADPTYQFGRQGLELLEQGDLVRAEEHLDRSLTQRPDDPDVIGGMGLVRLQQERHVEAQAFFERAGKLDADNATKWISLARTARFRGSLRRSEEALAAGDAALAARQAHAALQLDARSPDALVTLGRAQYATGRRADAERTWRQALRIAPTDAGALRALFTAAVALDGTVEAIDRAEAALTAAQRAVIAEEIAATRARLIREQADRLLSAGHTTEAIRLLEAATETDQRDPWLHYDLARLYQRVGTPDRGIALLDALMKQPGTSADAVHASALFHMNLDDPRHALAVIEKLPESERTGSVGRLERRIRVRLHTTDATSFARGSQFDEAMRALAAAEEIAANDPELLIDVALAWIDIDQDARGEQLLATVVSGIESKGYSVPAHRVRAARVALLQAEARQHLRNNHLAEAVRALEQAVVLDGDNPWLRLDLARLLYRQGAIDQGRRVMMTQVTKFPADPESRYALALYLSQAGQVHDALETLERIPVSERTDPMVRTQQRLHSTLTTILDERTSWFSGGLDGRHRSGSSGTSRMNALELPLEWKRPLGETGRVYFRTDLVSVDAGAMELANARDASEFGTVLLCQPDCDAGRFAQTARGVALTAGYEWSRSRVDLGVSPLGFAVVRPTAGLRHRGDLGEFSYSLDLSSRPLTSTLLSYAGTRDPRTDVVWGGVQASGLSVTLSRDDGGAFGAWASFGVHRLTGRNVLTNDRIQILAGAYWRIINETDRLLSIGVSGMVWRFSENAGEFTFGHGGYFSPYSFRSMALPITYGKRSPRFSYVIRAALSTSRTHVQGAPYFPTDPAMQTEAQARASITGVDPRYDESRGGGRGHTLRMTLEHKLAPQLFIGSLLEIERSRDYEPSRLLIYLRHSLDRLAARPMIFPPRPFLPTAEY